VSLTVTESGEGADGRAQWGSPVRPTSDPDPSRRPSPGVVRFGSAVALGVLPLSVVGVTDLPLSLIVLCVTGVLAIDVDAADERDGSARRPPVADDSDDPGGVKPPTDGRGERGDAAALAARDDRSGRERLPRI
jgi:hypothetical protein